MNYPLQALLVGVDHHPESDSDDLFGAVADVVAMRGFLLRQGVPPEAIRSLVSQGPGAEPLEDVNGRPTYENLVKEIRHLGRRAARRGGRALLHFSGHGSRTASILPEVKRHDECLVPCDLATPGGRWLRDVEMTWLLDEMLQHGVHVTLVLDSCHAGGVMRREEHGRARRVIADHMATAPEMTSSVASVEDLERVWRRIHRQRLHTLRHVTAELSGWLSPHVLRRGGVTLLAACRQREEAMEHFLDGHYRGAMTYHLVKILETPPEEGWTWRRVHGELDHRLRSLASPRIARQTPILEGDGGGLGLSGGPGAANRVLITAIDSAHGRVLLGAGQALGIVPGSRWALDAYDPGAPPVAFEVVQVAAHESWARCLAPKGAVPLDVAIGDPLRWQSPGGGLLQGVLWTEVAASERRRSSRGNLRDGSLRLAPTAVNGQIMDWLAEELPTVRAGVNMLKVGDQPVETPEDGSSPGEAVSERAVWRVQVKDGHCHILSPPGLPLKGLPVIRVAERQDVRQVVDTLHHLACWNHFWSRRHREPSMQGTLRLHVGRLSPDFQTDDVIEPRVLPPGERVFNEGQWLALGLELQSGRPMHCGVLALRWDGSMEWLYPQQATGEELEPGSIWWLPFRIGCSHLTVGQGVERLKVLATAEPMALTPWKLPPVSDITPRPRLTQGDERGEDAAHSIPPGGWPEALEPQKWEHPERYWLSADIDLTVEPSV